MMIISTRLLLELEPSILAEGLSPHDPWDEPPRYPQCAERITVLYVDGRISRELEPDLVDWRDVAGFRFETTLGAPVDLDDDDDLLGCC